MLLLSQPTPCSESPSVVATWLTFKVHVGIVPILQVGNKDQRPALECAGARTQTRIAWGWSPCPPAGSVWMHVPSAPPVILFSNSASHSVVLPKLAWFRKITQARNINADSQVPRLEPLSQQGWGGDQGIYIFWCCSHMYFLHFLIFKNFYFLFFLSQCT